MKLSSTCIVDDLKVDSRIVRINDAIFINLGGNEKSIAAIIELTPFEAQYLSEVLARRAGSIAQ